MTDSSKHNARKREAADEPGFQDTRPHHDPDHSSRPTKKMKSGEDKEDTKGETQRVPSDEHQASSLSRSQKLDMSEDKDSKGTPMDIEVDNYSSDDDDDGDDGEVSSDDDKEDDEDIYGDEYDEDEDEDAHDYDIENHEQVIAGEPEQVVKLRVAVCKEYGEDFYWLENIHVTCTLEGKVIGNAVARYILRENMRSNFREEMEQPSQELADLAFDLFDRYGCVKAKFKDHSVQKGSGVWGEELDYGPLLLVEYIIISRKDLRGKGLGKAMMNLLVQKAEMKSKPEPTSPTTAMFREIWYRGRDMGKYSKLHTIVLPGWLRTDVEEQWKGKSRQERRVTNKQAIDTAVAFYRSIGFRRIGASGYFALSSDSEHKSHAIAIQDDFDLPEQSSISDTLDDDDDDDEESENDFFGDKKEKKRLERLKRILPLHHAALTMSDIKCLEFFKKFPQDSASWNQVNKLGNNLLHVVACQVLPLSTKWLVEKSNAGKTLLAARNHEGYNPLEALQDQLEVKRTKMEVRRLTVDISDQFTGFSQEAVECLSALVVGIGTHQELSEAHYQRLKYGCTCGECLGGFISPRMVLAFLYQAGTSHDMLDRYINDGPFWCDIHDYMLVHVDPALRQNFQTNKSYRQGFANIFDYVATCLRSKIIPTSVNVLREFHNGPNEWPPVTRNYLERGGTVEGKIEPILRILFDHAEDQDSMTGDGDFEVVMGDEVSKLKVCRNDHEFGFVAMACGVPRENED